MYRVRGIHYACGKLHVIGREAHTASLQLSKAGVDIVPHSSKIVVDDHEKSSMDNVFAIGDAMHVSKH